MKKKIFAIVLCVAMLAIAIAGGTLAYFTDNDAKTNTFTMGDVKIHVDEWMENAEGEWVAYVDQELHPIAANKAPFNKLVETVNDGSEDAYIRTFITCPAEDYWDLGYGFNSGATAVDMARPNVSGNYTMHCLDKWTDIGKTTLANGEEVYIFMCEHKEAIPTGDSILSMTKVWVYDTVDNDDIGSEIKVRVFSEAIQKENLTYEEAMASLNGGKTDLEHATELFNELLSNN